MVNMKITNKNKIITIEFPTRKEMCLTMFRIAEFYESPYKEIKGNYFTPDEFIDKYSDKNGNIDYFSKWDGFNIPITNIISFVRGYALNFSSREIDLLSLFYSDIKTETLLEKDLNYRYLITYVKGDKDTLLHEMVHAKYYLDKDYHNKVNEIISKYDKKVIAKYKKHLKGMEYCNDVLIDEINAYCVAFSKAEHKKEFSTILESEYKSLVKELQKLYKAS